MAGFGWSVGDLVASLQLVVKIAGALKETGGAKSDYQESIEFLLGLETTLQNLRSVAPSLVNQPQESAVQLEAKKIVKPLSIFLAKIQNFHGALGLESKRSPWRTAPRKVQWAIFVSKEVKKLRDRISVPMFSLNILLQSQTLLAVSSLQERLPSDISERLASGIENAVSKGLRDELDSLRSMMGKYEVDSTVTPGNNSQEADQTTQSLNALPPEQLALSQPAGKSLDSSLNSRLDKFANDQLVEMESLKRSLSTIIALQRLPLTNPKSHESYKSSTTPFSELKTTFAKCMVLLALSLRELFNSALIYLGPQFLLFMLTFKELGSRIPKMLLDNNSILFEDVLGRRKYLPIEFFQHYNVFNTFLRESFMGVPGQRYIFNQQYRLADSKNELVDSTTWQETIIKRSNIIMSVMLEKLTDDEDGTSCPRCWMPKTSTEQSVVVQCSSCSLIYTTNIPVNVPAKTNQLDSSIPSEAGSKDANLPLLSSEIPAYKPGPSENEWTKVEISTPVKNNRPKGDDSPTRSEKTTILPWGSHQDLMHFKRVQVADLPNREILPQSSALLQLLVVLSRMRDLTDYAIPRSGTQHGMRLSFEAVLAQITNCTQMIHVFFEHQSFEALKLNTGEGWKTKTWSTAWAESVRLSLRSKELISVARLMCQDLQRNHKIVTANEVFAQWNQTVTLFNMHSVALKGYLDLLKKIDDAWRHGGQGLRREITRLHIDEERITNDTPADHGAATCLVVTPRYIVVALDNNLISIFDHKNNFLRNLQGHQIAVWAMAVHFKIDDILVSGGSDRNVHVWDMNTGDLLYALRGHTSTIRCMTFIDKTTIVSGSRDTTLRIWDIRAGLCKLVLTGHVYTVRCVETKGDRIVSGSYDSCLKVWGVSDGKCYRTLVGHLARIYSIAFDGKTVVSGSVDTSVRVWDVETGICRAKLEGHSSFVGKLSLRDDIVMSGSSDGTFRKWSLGNTVPVFQVAAHENSLTSLHFDHRRVLTGSSDGTVKVWDAQTGELVRELGDPSDAVWQTHLSEKMAVIIKSLNNKCIIEVWSFSHDDFEDKDSTIYQGSQVPLRTSLGTPHS